MAIVTIMTTSALATLTATYTDSEGEDDIEENNGNDSEKSLDNSKSPFSDRKSNASLSRPESPNSNSNSNVTVKSKYAKLVSYHDDAVVSDEEGEIEEYIPEPMEFATTEVKADEPILIDTDGILIPPEPPGHSSHELQEKINKLHQKMLTQKMDMNALIQQRKDFRNPSIYEKLIQFCGLNELGTNYPPAIYDPLKWSKESFYEDLAKVQKAEIDKRERERKGKIEIISGTKKTDENEKNKRKSKWDMPGGTSVKVNKPGLVAPPNLTSSASGTKATVISAFGSLPKKMKN